jgi:hypothetical protein
MQNLQQKLIPSRRAEHRPARIASRGSIALAGSDLEFVEDMRRPCLERIVQVKDPHVSVAQGAEIHSFQTQLQMLNSRVHANAWNGRSIESMMQ